jgi:hypothetical protein
MSLLYYVYYVFYFYICFILLLCDTLFSNTMLQERLVGYRDPNEKVFRVSNANIHVDVKENYFIIGIIEITTPTPRYLVI